LGKSYFVYLLTNAEGSLIYTGITNDLKRRLQQHRSGRGGRFTRSFRINKLLYYEICESKKQAMSRELQIKRSGRKKKIELIERENKEWRDLFEDI
jgi:putative endonuclease